MSKIINIHPAPDVKNYDHHLPYVAGPTRNKHGRTRHGPEVFAEKVKELTQDDSEIILTNNGEPRPRLDQARLSIEKYIKDKKVLIKKELNLKYADKDLIFKKKQYTLIRNVIDKKLIEETLDYYALNYKSMPYYSERFNDRDHGFFEYGKMLWYNHGLKMPETKNIHHLNLNTMLDEIWLKVAQICIDIFKKNQINLSNLYDKLNLRIVHNRREEDDEGKKFFKHLDGTIITGWLTQRPFGAKIYDYVDESQTYENTRPIDIDTLYDNKSTDILIIPGTSYCDYCNIRKAATWHEVSVPINYTEDRFSMIFLLRNPEFEKTNYNF